MSKTVRRLFAGFQPEHYDLQLDIDPAAMTFTGSVIIRGQKTGRPSQRLTFHQKGLVIDEAYVRRSDKKSPKIYEVARINNQNSYDEVRLHCDDMLYPGEYTVMINYHGAITRNMEGIYPCFFTLGGHEKKLIATQFESHHAREAFPCIDEPEAKATFDLILTTPPVKAVLSNTPVKEQFTNSAEQPKPGDEKLRTIFETTPRMSTYLLAFAFGDMEYLEAKTKDGVLVRTYATPDNVKHTQFALDCAVKTLEFYNEYFAVPYPLAKCDFIALPDFASGAMENWGCITFREQALLVDPKNTSLHLKQYVANVVAHELTHQWFGNLVTMRWWTDLWLNESFASWMSYLAVDHLFPDWKVWTQFIVDEQGLALKQDALENTHPIEVSVNHPDEIRTIFDAISYEKGASVLNMLHDYLGADAFRDGLRLYLKRHAYGNTDTVDLWTALEEVSKQPVRQFMGAWTSQSGYPLLTATVDGEQLRAEQVRFYLNPDAEKVTASWPVPLLGSPELTDDTLDRSQENFALHGPGDALLLNSGRTGFYRVLYDPAHTARLAAEVRAGNLSDLDRLGLLGDSFEAAKAGYGSTTGSLKLLEAYADEDNTVVWDIIAGNTGSLRTVMGDTVRERLKPFVRQLTAKQLKRLGWQENPQDSHFDRLLRPTILGLASVAEEPAVVAEAMQRFAAMKRSEDISPDLRGTVYGTAARHGDKKEFEKLLKMHNSSANSEERVTIAAALTNFEQPELIQRALGMITSDEVRLQDASYWIAYSFMNRHARVTTWDWLVAHWDWLRDNLGSDLSFYRMPNYAARCFSDRKFLKTYTDFFAAHLSPAFDRPVKQGIETIQWQAAWKERDQAAIEKFLDLGS